MTGEDRVHQDRTYWLPRCKGFRVDSPAGELGTVAEILSPALPGRPEALAIALATRSSPLYVVGTDEVESICPRERRLRLRHAPPARR